MSSDSPPYVLTVNDESLTEQETAALKEQLEALKNE